MNQLLISVVLCSWLWMSCANPERDQRLDEAALYLTAFMEEKRSSLDMLYSDCKRQASDADDQEIAQCTALHRLGNNFYTLADSVVGSYQESNDSKVDGRVFHFLDSVYAITVDSMKMHFPEAVPRDYGNSPHHGSVILRASRMKHDVMRIHQSALNFYFSVMSTRFRQSFADDATGLATVRFPSAGDGYSFSVNNKFMQQFPYREIMIDSITVNGKRSALSPRIGARDIIRVVEFHDLKRGRYLARINVGNTHFFSHRFQIK